MPNIVVTPPQDVDEQGSSPQIIKIDETLLHSRPPRRLPTFCILHKILTDDEFEEEERYLYGSIT